MFDSIQHSRRNFIKYGTLALATTCVHPSTLRADEQKPIKIALVTDLHYADKAPNGSRHYRETLSKLEEAALQFEKSQPDFLVELGDFIDAAASVDTEKSYLTTINNEFAPICSERHYVLGNHCVDTLTKQEFLSGVEQRKSFYSFDRGGFHFVVLDSCFRSDGQPYGRKNFTWTDANVPEHELEWLRADLKANDKPTIVFAHQRLDVSNNHGVRNNSAVREVLENSGNVTTVFQGHSHKNDLKQINGIHYCTMVAMVEGSGQENNGYSLLTLSPNGSLHLDGFRKQSDYAWS